MKPPEKHEFVVLKDGINCTSEADIGRYVFYLCLTCNGVVSSCATDDVCCSCGNIAIDFCLHRLCVGDYKKIQVISKKHTLFVPGRNKDEPRTINNALHEICNGFDSDFENKTGFPLKHAVRLLDRIRVAYDEAKTSGKQTYISLNQNEAFVINSALKAVLDGIERFEFQTRMGVDMKYAIRLHKKYRGIAQNMGQQPPRENCL